MNPNLNDEFTYYVYSIFSPNIQFVDKRLKELTLARVLFFILLPDIYGFSK